MFGGALGLSAAQSAFANKIISTLTTSAPDVDPLLVIHTGATDLRKVFSPEQVPGILVAYMQGIKASFAVSVGMVGFAFLLSFFNTWKRVHETGAKKGEVGVMT